MKLPFKIKTGRMLPLIVALFIIVAAATVSITLIFNLLSRSFILQRDVRIAQASAAHVIRLQVDEETGIRGYLLYHDKRFLQPYTVASKNFSARIAVLEQQMTNLGLPRSWWYVEDIRQRNAAWLKAEVDPILRDDSKPDVVRDYAGKQMVDYIRTDGILLTNVLERRAQLGDEETVHRFTDVITLCISLVGLTVFAVLLLARRQERLETDLELQSRAADAFQRAALPSDLPVVPGISFDSVYVPASSESRIGGDWYDALRLMDGRIVISIGDVAGFGLHASVTMAAVRQSIRAAAEMNPEPLMILDAADRTLKAQQPDRIVTSFVCVYDPVAQTISYASAGHPPAILRKPDGCVLELDRVGLPLGLRVRDDTDVLQQVPFTPGSFLVFYTDGLTEAKRDVVSGMNELHSLVENDLVALSATPARAIYEVMLPSGTADDVAVMTVRSLPGVETGLRRWYINAMDAVAATTVRHEFIALLKARNVRADDLFSAELVFGEMIGNVVRYAPGDVEIVFDYVSSPPVLHFIDGGSGFSINPRLPSDNMSERGRGLFLVWSLADEFTVSRRPTGGSHARAVLSARPQPTYSLASQGKLALA